MTTGTIVLITAVAQAQADIVRSVLLLVLYLAFFISVLADRVNRVLMPISEWILLSLTSILVIWYNVWTLVDAARVIMA